MRIKIISFLILFLIAYILITKHWECNEKGPPFTSFSRSIKESKDKDVFEFEVVPYKANMMLDSGHKLEIKSAWLENVWTKHVYIGGSSSIEKHDWHQLILIYDIVTDTQLSTKNLHYFVGGRTVSDSFTHYDCEKNDTIKVPLFKQTSRRLPAIDKRKAYDSLTFVRR
jgi:hypothetical protein